MFVDGQNFDVSWRKKANNIGQFIFAQIYILLKSAWFVRCHDLFFRLSFKRFEMNTLSLAE